MATIDYIGVHDLVSLTIKSPKDYSVQPTIVKLKTFITEASGPELSTARIQEIIVELGKDKSLNETISATKHIIVNNQSLMLLCNAILAFFVGSQQGVGNGTGDTIAAAGGKMTRNPTADESSAWAAINES